MSPDPEQDPKHFQRKRKLPFERLVTFVLHIVGGDTKGVDIKSGLFFKMARRSGVWLNAQQVTRSAVTKARKKLSWKVFRRVFSSVVGLAYQHWPQDAAYLWHGMSVFAIDGSKFTLPASHEIRDYFDPNASLRNAGQGHYPMALVSTAFDVFRRIPVARTVEPVKAAERTEAMVMLPDMPVGIVLYDRGYPSYEFILDMMTKYDGHFLLRCSASNTFPVVERFLESGREDGIVEIAPSKAYQAKRSVDARRELAPVTVRVLRVAIPNGETSVCITDLLDSDTFSHEEVAALYRRRWEVENYYRDEKVHLDVETFHTRSVNGIRQELFAVVIMAVIARTLMVLSMEPSPNQEEDAAARTAPSTESRRTEAGPQFKNAVMALGQDIACLVPDEPWRAMELFAELLEQIRKVKYHRPKEPRPSRPRVSMQPINKWNLGRAEKIRVA